MTAVINRIKILLTAQQAYRQAKSLANTMWRHHYRATDPNWTALDDTVGVITQIDNMYAGVREENSRLRHANDRLLTALKQVLNCPAMNEDFQESETLSAILDAQSAIDKDKGE